MRFTTTFAFVLLVSVVAIGPGSASSADSPVSAEKQASPMVASKPHSLTDRADLEAFFDGIVHEQLDFKHVAGAVVAVVAGNEVVFSKGYGFADVEARRPVDPETTQFRIASVSKLFVATAVMQLVEQGKLDLDADINTYLKAIKVPATYAEPITLKHLLTHTPGFEDNPIGLFSHRADVVRPLEEVLRAQMPARVRPPGVLGSYSNFGAALAALAVADVSGMPYEEFVEQRIFEPLGMKHMLIRQPAADMLPAALSKGYSCSTVISPIRNVIGRSRPPILQTSNDSRGNMPQRSILTRHSRRWRGYLAVGP